MSFAHPRMRQKRDLPQPVGGSKIMSKVNSNNYKSSSNVSKHIDSSKSKLKNNNAQKAKKRQHAEDEKEKYLAELSTIF